MLKWVVGFNRVIFPLSYPAAALGVLVSPSSPVQTPRPTRQILTSSHATGASHVSVPALCGTGWREDYS